MEKATWRKYGRGAMLAAVNSEIELRLLRDICRSISDASLKHV